MPGAGQQCRFAQNGSPFGNIRTGNQWLAKAALRPVHNRTGGFLALALLAALACGFPAEASSSARRPSTKVRDAGSEKLHPVGKKPKAPAAECGFQDGVFIYALPDRSSTELGPDKKMLDAEEVVHEVWCNEKRAFILTNLKWIIVEGNAHEQRDGRTRLRELFSYKDLGGKIGKGPVSWIPTEDRIFLKSDEIREIPLKGAIVIHGAGMNPKAAKIFLDSGLLFMAPLDGKLVVDQIGTDVSAEAKLPRTSPNASFSRKGGKLYFGETEIEISWNPDGTFKGFRFLPF
jgi:hypothetical protein